MATTGTESDGSAATPGPPWEQRSWSLFPSFFLFHAFSFFLCCVFLSFVCSLFCPFSSVIFSLFSRSLFFSFPLCFFLLFFSLFSFLSFFPLKGQSSKKAEDTTEKHCGRSGRRTKAHVLSTRGRQLSPRLWERRDIAQGWRCRPKGPQACGRVGEGRTPDRARVTRPLRTGRPPGPASSAQLV